MIDIDPDSKKQQIRLYTCNNLQIKSENKRFIFLSLVCSLKMINELKYNQMLSILFERHCTAGNMRHII